MDIQEGGLKRHGLLWSGSGQGQVADTCRRGNKHSGSIKCGELLDQLRTAQFQKQDSAPWSNYYYYYYYYFNSKLQQSVVHCGTFSRQPSNEPYLQQFQSNPRFRITIQTTSQLSRSFYSHTQTKTSSFQIFPTKFGTHFSTLSCTLRVSIHLRLAVYHQKLRYVLQTAIT